MSSRLAFALSFFLPATAAISPALAQEYVISTIAGGAPQPTPVPALSVSIGSPFGVATDAGGNVYFSSLDAVFKLDSNGTLTRVAGNSRAGYSGDGGPAINAQLHIVNSAFDDSEVYTGGLAIDRAGNLYIADGHNGRVRKVSPSGIITTVAGGGACVDPCDGGPATSAQLYFPSGLAVDPAGNLYISDAYRSRVRMVSPSGIINTVAGNGTSGYAGDGGPATGAKLGWPSGLAVDRAGNLYIADTGNRRVRKVSSAGLITTIAGNGGSRYYSGDGGPATGADLGSPYGLAFDRADQLYIAQAGAHIRKISVDGTITTVAGLTVATGVAPPPCCVIGDGGPATSAQLSYTLGVAVDSDGMIYIADTYNYRIRKVSPSGIITTVAGNGTYDNYYGYAGDGGPATSAQLRGVQGMAVDTEGNLFVADYQHYSVRKISPAGIITTVAGVGGSQGYSGDGGPAAKAQIGAPSALALDRAGNLYIATTGNYRVRKVSASGIITTVAGNGSYGFSGDGGPATSAQLGNASGLAVDSAGNLYIAQDFRVRQISPDGIITTLAQTGAVARGLAIDSSGNLYFAGDGRVGMVSPAGAVTTVAGNGIWGYSGDGGPATGAQLYPSGIAADRDGNLYVADRTRIRKISLDGIITTIAGDGTDGSSGDGGPAISAQLSRPQAIAVDSSGNVYVGEYSAVRLLQPVSSSVVISGVANAASYVSGPVAAGEIVTITGSGLGPGRATVRMNGMLAPIINTSAMQVTAIVPYSIYGDTARITVTYQGRTSALFSVPLAFSAPGIFTLDSSGRGQAAAINADGSTNSAATPASAGDIILLFATGEGQTSPEAADGGLASAPAPHPIFPVSVTIGGRTLIPAYAGGAPGQVAGVMQINVAIPSGIPSGSAVPVVVQVGNTSSQAGVTIAVR